VAATLELRGYSLSARRPEQRHEPSRHDARFYLVGATMLAVALVGKALGADDFHTYPTIQMGFGAGTAAVCAVVLAGGLATWRGRSRVGRRAGSAGGPRHAATGRGRKARTPSGERLESSRV
jgi:hypothetical protein